jgi:8-amino-3,8-dideoxy-alpha-D-manno-octulosonate transaminase
MPGFEVFGEEERQAINEIFDLNGGVLFAHAFDSMRNGVYRVREYEKAFAETIGVPYAQAVSSGTAAVLIALKAAGVQPGDEVITQSFTFVATVEAIITAGAQPVIVDIDETLNMDPNALEAAISDKTKAIMPVHMLGGMARMDEILAIAEQHGVAVVEDAAQGLGGMYKGRPAGTLGVTGAYSTDAGKTLTTGEGGMVVTAERDAFLFSRSFHDHGHEYSETNPDRGDEAAMCVGFNYRMSELQGAIGIAQLKKLEMIIGCQRANFAKLMDRLKDLPLAFRDMPDPDGDCGDTLVFMLPDAAITKSFVARMTEVGVGSKNLPDGVKWHFSKHWGHMFGPGSRYQNSYRTEWQKSADILDRSIALGVGVKMTEDEINDTADKIAEIAADLL